MSNYKLIGVDQMEATKLRRKLRRAVGIRN